MDFNEYQSRARETAIYPYVGANLWYPALGLAGETGEVAEKIKKIYRDNNGKVKPDKREDLKYELGDVLWYIANLASELGYTLEDIAIGNLAKLNSRVINNTVHGEGDKR